MRKKSFKGKKILIITAAAVAVVFVFSLLWKYSENIPAFDYHFGEDTLQNMVEYEDVRFAVISDLHYYDPDLGTSGPAFEAYLQSDRKLLKESGALLDLAVDKILKANVDFVLISGDLTKDGEKNNHQKIAKILSRFTRQGIRVYVVPGNHDVNNPGAFRYEGEKCIPVESVSPEDYTDIYNDFGYGNALFRDRNSLSYVAEAGENLWLVALDTCRFEENRDGGKAIVGGKLDKSQEKWLEEILMTAREKKKAVIVMAHHGIIEHWKGHRLIRDAFLVKDYQHIGKLLASYGVRISFTGHFHAQDIAKADFGEQGFLYDIETGSLLTPPCPIRYCTIKDNRLMAESESLVDQLYPGTGFKAEAEQFILDSVASEARDILGKVLVTGEEADKISGYAAQAFAAHYPGDEDASVRPPFDKKKLGLWSRFIYNRLEFIIDGLWNDPEPADNDVVLDLRFPT